MHILGFRTFMPFFGFGFLIEILFWVLFAILIAKIVSYIFSRKDNSGEDIEQFKDTENALNILKRRYAKGEITKKEFESMKNDIK